MMETVEESQMNGLSVFVGFIIGIIFTIDVLWLGISGDEDQ